MIHATIVCYAAALLCCETNTASVGSPTDVRFSHPPAECSVQALCSVVVRKTQQLAGFSAARPTCAVCLRLRVNVLRSTKQNYEALS